MEIAYRPFVAAARALLLARGLRLDVEDGHHVPREGPVLLAGNHISETDPFAVGLALDGIGRRPRFLAKQELFDTPVLGSVLRQLKQVPVDRAVTPAASLPRALLTLESGEAVVLFPEGTVSSALVPAEPKHGAARLALASGAPLVPFATWGGQRVGHPAAPSHPSRGVLLVVRFGPPVPCTPGEPVAAVTSRLWSAVEHLVDEVQRSYPQQPADDDDRWWLPRHLGGTAPSVEEAAEERRRKAAERAARAEQRRRDAGDGAP